VNYTPRILIIDDNDRILKMLRQTLEREEGDVMEASEVCFSCLLTASCFYGREEVSFGFETGESGVLGC
jgi:CheY-like chemotaxis protein